MREQQRRALREKRPDFRVQRLLREVGNQHRHQVRTLDRIGRHHHLQAILFRLVPTFAFAHADHDVIAAVAQIERVRASLASITEDRDACAAQRFLVDVFLGVQTHAKSPDPEKIAQLQNARPRVKTLESLKRGPVICAQAPC